MGKREIIQDTVTLYTNAAVQPAAIVHVEGQRPRVSGDGSKVAPKTYKLPDTLPFDVSEALIGLANATAIREENTVTVGDAAVGDDYYRLNFSVREENGQRRDVSIKFTPEGITPKTATNEYPDLLATIERYARTALGTQI